MTLISSYLGILAFRSGALRFLSDRRALVPGLFCFAGGYLSYALVRSRVYEFLPEMASYRQAGSLFAVAMDLLRALVFLLVIYVPFIAAASNAVSGYGLGFSLSRRDYQGHLAVLLPLWGMLFLIVAPLQWLFPHFLVLGETFEFSIGIVSRSILVALYTLWAIRRLNYLSGFQALGVFALSCFTYPLYFLLASFALALPLFFMIPLIYWGIHWVRSYLTSHAGERELQLRLQALTVNPQDADAHYQLGLIHLKRGDLNAARERFQKAMEIDPADADYHYHLGRVHERKGEWDHALERYEETYRLNPEYGFGDIFREVGKAYLHAGFTAKAIEFLKFFLTKRGSDPEGRYWLAVAFQKMGDDEQARAQLSLIAEQARLSPRFFRRENREWIYRARNMLRDSGAGPGF